MTAHARRHNQPANDTLHPVLYRTMVGLAIWLVLSVWILFDRGGGYVELALAMVTLFFIVLAAIPTLIWLSWRKAARPHDEVDSFLDWTSHEFKTWTGTLSGRAAAVQILLPLAAVSIGMTIFGLVFYFDVPHLG